MGFCCLKFYLLPSNLSTILKISSRDSGLRSVTKCSVIPLNKRIKRAGGSGFKPLFERLLTALHPVLHYRFKSGFRLASA